MKNSPKLRFPEFKDNGEWEEKRLDSIADVVPSGDLDSEYFSLISTDKHIYPVYSNSVTEEGLYGYYTYPKYEKNSVTITARGTLGVAFTRHQDFMGIGRLLVVSNLQNTLPYFLKESWNYLAKIPLENGGIPQLTAVKAKAVLLAIPKPNEQQKIADCLSSVDSLISVQSQKVELLKEHKKGLMQQLFPQDGEEEPKLRFPEFENAPKWEEKFIEDFFAVGSSKRVLQEEWTSQGVPFYRTRELVSLSKNQPFGSEIFISEELFLELSEKYGIPSAGDFLVSGVGTLGICYQVQNNDKFYFKDGNVIWFKLVKKLNSNYFKYCFQSDHIQNQIFAQSSASTVGTYTIQNAKKTRFWYPPTFQEQQKIADCLSSIDEQITSQTQKLQTLKEHKKALMQQLFPSAKEL